MKTISKVDRENFLIKWPGKFDKDIKKSEMQLHSATDFVIFEIKTPSKKRKLIAFFAKFQIYAFKSFHSFEVNR